MRKMSVAVRKMSMPGFTAMLSLGKPAYKYVLGQTGSVNRHVAPVVPSLFIGTHAPDCPWPCRVIGNNCVCPFG